MVYKAIISFFDYRIMLKVRSHIIFWLVITILLTAVFGKIFEDLVLSFYFVCMLLPVALSTSYFFNYYLVPKFLLRKRYLRFALYFIYLLIISTYLEMWVIAGSFVLLADLNYSRLSPVVTNIFILAIILYFIVFLKAFVLLVRHSFRIQKETKSLEAEKKKMLKGFLTVRSERKKVNVPYDTINYIESIGDYIKIVTESAEPVICHERISHIIKKLPEHFIRIHRSFIVNSRKVNLFSKTELNINDITLPVSRTYKEEVSHKLAKRKI